MATRTKKQHIVPRFYLERFRDKDGMVWTYDFEPANFFCRKPEDTAAESNFYSPAGKDGSRNDLLEDLLANIESNAAPLWPDLENGKLMVGDERVKIALFVAMQFLRSPTVILGAAGMVGQFLDHTARVLSSSKEGHDASIDAYDRRTGNVTSPEKREELRIFLGDSSKYEIHVSRTAGLMSVLSVEPIARILLDMKWVVGRSVDQHLITSDSPVALVSDPQSHSPLYGSGGFLNKTVRVSFPLSAEGMLEMTWVGNERERVVELPKSHARTFNGLRAEWASRFLYANQQDYGIIALGKKWILNRNGAALTPDNPGAKVVVKRKLDGK